MNQGVHCHGHLIFHWKKNSLGYFFFSSFPNSRERDHVHTWNFDRKLTVSIDSRARILAFFFTWVLGQILVYFMPYEKSVSKICPSLEFPCNSILLCQTVIAHKNLSHKVHTHQSIFKIVPTTLLNQFDLCSYKFSTYY